MKLVMARDQRWILVGQVGGWGWEGETRKHSGTPRPGRRVQDARIALAWLCDLQQTTSFAKPQIFPLKSEAGQGLLLLLFRC